MDAIDNDNVDIDETCNRIISGVLHHPAQREMGENGAREGRALMFQSVEQWWNDMDRSQQDEYRRKLSRDGVERGDNHKEGVHDTGHGHGCSGKLGMHKQFGSDGPQSMEDKIANQAAGAIIGGLTGGISDIVSQSSGGKINLPTSDKPTQGGGLLGAASSLLSGAFSSDETNTYESRPQRRNDGGVSQTVEQYGRSSDGRRFEQAELTETRYSDGRETQEYQRYEQRDDGHGREQGYGYEQRTETYGSHSRTEERRFEGGDSYERRDEGGRQHGGEGRHHGRRDDDEGGFGGGFGGGRREERREEGGWGGDRPHGGEGRHHGRRDDDEGGFGGGRQEFGGGRQEYGGGREEYGGGRQEYGGGRDEYGGGRQEYGGGREEFGGGRQEFGGGRQEGGWGEGGGRRRGDDDDGEQREGGWGEGRRRDDDERRGGGGGGGWFS